MLTMAWTAVPAVPTALARTQRRACAQHHHGLSVSVRAVGSVSTASAQVTNSSRQALKCHLGTSSSSSMLFGLVLVFLVVFRQQALVVHATITSS